MVVKVTARCVVVVLAMFSVACELINAPKGITCAKLRQLRVGMTEAQVGALLGAPNGKMSVAGYVGKPALTDPIAWDYSNRSDVDGGVRLFVQFDQGRVVEVNSWIRTLLRDFKDDVH